MLLRVLSLVLFNPVACQSRALNCNAFGSFRTLASLRGGDVASGGDGIPEFPTSSESFVPRYNGPPIDEMTDEQRTIRDDIIRARPCTGISGPFGPWLAVPDIGRPSQELGRACRFGTTLSARESELIILLTGARHKAHAEFDIHQGEALRSGLTLDIISAIPRDEDFSVERVQSDLLPLLAESERDVAIAHFTAELLETSTISEETYQATLQAVGDKESVLVEITSIIGYYTYVAYTLNTFNIPFVRSK